MTSINYQDEKYIEEFFKAYILPLHQQAESREISYFDLGSNPNKDTDTYFETPNTEYFTYYTFYEMSTQEELKDHLANLWSDLGNDEMEGLSDKLAELALLFKTKQIEQSDELSPYVYPMF